MERARRHRAAFVALLFSAGAFSFVAQSVLYREHLVLYQGSELSIGLFFGSWLLWVALGALLARLPRLTAALAPRLALIALFYAAAPLLQLWLIRSFRALAGLPAWEAFPLGQLLGLTALANAPVSLLTGLLFVVACAAAKEAPGNISRNYVAECAGSFVGGLAVTGLLVAEVQAVTLLFGAATLLLLGATAVARVQGRRLLLGGCGVALVAVLAIWLAGGTSALERAAETRRWRGVLPGAQLVDWTDTPQQHLAVGRLGNQTVVAENGEISYAFPDEPGLALEAALVMTQVPDARRVLVIGDALGGLLRHLLSYGPERLVWLDPDPAATAFIRGHLLPADRAALDDPRLEVIAGDPRARLAALDNAFDLVAVLLTDPDTAQRNRYFTEAFYRAVRARLRATGALVTRVQGQVNYLGKAAASYGASVAHTLQNVFDQVLVGPGEQQWIFAGGRNSAITLDGAALGRRYDRAALAGPRPFSGEQLNHLWPPGRVALLRQRYAAAARQAPDALLNTDRRPVTYFHALAYRARALDSEIGEVLIALRRGGIGLFIALILLLVLLRGHRAAGEPTGPEADDRLARFNAVILVGVTGAAGMALQTLLMFAFQSRFGALFQQVGLVSGLFMFGLAAGGLLLIWIARRARSVPWAAIWAVVGGGTFVVVAVPLSLDLLAGWPPPAQRAGFFALFIIAGVVTASGFPLAEAVFAAGQPAGVIAARLESADHWGGAIAALLSGTLLVPTLGFRGTGWVLAGGFVGLALLLAQQQLRRRRAAPTRVVRWMRERAAFRSFPRRDLSYLLAALALAALVSTLIVRGALDQGRTHFTPDELARLTDGTTFEQRERPFVHYRVDPVDRGQAAAGVAASMAVSPEVRGYAGPINLLVDVDASGKLRRVRLLQSRETPAYIEGIGRWLAGLHGRRIDRPLHLRPTTAAPGKTDDQRVDALTGATITAEATLRAVSRTGAALARQVHGLPVARADAGPGLWARLGQPAVLYLLGALLLVLPVARWASDRVRLAFLGLNLLCGGLVFNTQLSLVDIGRVITAQPPTPGNTASFVLFWGVLALSLLFGALYCGYLCPFGAAQEWLSRLGTRLGLARRLHHGLEDRARYLKYVLLALVVIGYALSESEALFAADPLRYQLGRQAAGWALVLLLLIGAGALIVFRPWCRYFCPVGAAINLLNRVRPLGRLLRQRRYGACDLGVDGSLDVDCLQCDRCVHGTTLALGDDQRIEAQEEALR